jgi:UDP-glucose 4-epimerase
MTFTESRGSMTRRIVVTGGAGFIGSHMTDALVAQGHQVTVIDSLVTGSRTNVAPQASFVEADVRHEADLVPIFENGIDAVFHIAGQASIRKSFMEPVDDLNVNTLGTLNVLKLCVKFSVPRLLYASSMTVYGDPQQVPTPEDHPIDPRSYYGLTKYTAERYVHLTAARRDLAAPLHVTSFRMFNVYGVRQSLTNAYQGVAAIFIGNVLRGEPITIHGDGQQTRDFINVADVVQAWLLALDTPGAYGQVFNLGTGVPTTINAVCDAVLAAFGHTRASYPVRHAPAQEGDVFESAADIGKSRVVLGWTPQLSFAEGAPATITWAKRSAAEALAAS